VALEGANWFGDFLNGVKTVEPPRRLT